MPAPEWPVANAAPLMAALAVAPGDADGNSNGSARELLIPSREERTAAWTHYCCHVARLAFLLSHGVFVLEVSASLERLDEASWWALFLPVWIGDVLCLTLVIASWFVSCPYIWLCFHETQTRVGNNPSILTEVLPEIVLAVFGFVFLLFILAGEYFLCAYLDSEQQGEPHGLPAAAVLLSIGGLLAMCHGVLLTHNSALFSLAGGALLLGVMAFAVTRDGAPASAQALAVAPALPAIFGLLLVALHSLLLHRKVLSREECVLRAVEAIVLIALLFATSFLVFKISDERVREAGADGTAAGCALCLVALLRLRLCCWEARHGHPDERLTAEAAAPAVIATLGQISINMADSIANSYNNSGY